MNRAIKLWLLTAAVLVAAGILLFCFVMAHSHWDVSALGSADYETVTREIGESFQNISIRSDAEDVTLLPSGDGVCRAVFYERSTQRHSAAVEGGTLSITSEDSSKWYDHISFSVGSPSITLYLPGTAWGDLSVTGDTGDVTIPKELRFERIDVSTETGDIACRASAAGLIRLGTDTGAILAGELSAGELSLSVSTGSLALRTADCSGAVTLTASTGKTVLEQVACGSLLSNGDTGDLRLEHVTAEGALSVTRSTGDVYLEDCDAAELEIRTGTGDVTGSLRSEKVFVARSDTGRIEVPESVSGGKCKITTDTGDIRIVIE